MNPDRACVKYDGKREDRKPLFLSSRRCSQQDFCPTLPPPTFPHPTRKKKDRKEVTSIEPLRERRRTRPPEALKDDKVSEKRERKFYFLTSNSKRIRLTLSWTGSRASHVTGDVLR